MQLEELALGFINNPFPSGVNDITHGLVGNKIKELVNDGVLESEGSYSSTAVLLKNKAYSGQNKKFLITEDHGTVHLELPSFEHLGKFYVEHGLQPLTSDELTSFDASAKIKSAFGILQYIPPFFKSIVQLVKTIQVLKQEDKDYDISFSHPGLPFTIFVSVCEDLSLASSLRVAEGILHEAMHLKLTLIDGIIPLVESGNTDTFYSPWRDEQRPLRGVLHGVFVFSMIKEFYTELIPFIGSPGDKDFLTWRVEQIRDELTLLQGFPDCPGLTKDGANLIINLLPLN